MMMAALCCLMLSFAACTRDNNENSDTITINTAALYEELGIQNEMSQALADGTCTITDTVLIYNQSGQLVKKLGAMSNTLQSLTFKVEGLADGVYTLVLWQAGNPGEAAWALSGEEQLSTANLIAPATPIDFALSAGYASATVTAKKGVVGANLTPKAIGSVIEMQIEKFSLTSFLVVSLFDFQPQHCTGIHLNPSLGENGRWINETQQETKNAVCRVVKETPSGKFFTLSHGENMEFQLWGKKTNGEDSIGVIKHKTIGSGENLVCYLNLYRRLWQPPFLGSSDAFNAWKADRDAGYVTVDPYLNWGASIAEVQQHINAKNWWTDGNEDFEFWGNPFNGWHKWYFVAPYLTEQYIYETSNGQNLRYVLSYCWDSNVPADARNKMLEHQGFHNTGAIVQFDGTTYERFLSADGVTEALAQTIAGYGNGWEVIYRPVNSQKKRK